MAQLNNLLVNGTARFINKIFGTIEKAETLATARSIHTNLESTTAASFNGSADITPGITGVLAIPNGGSGVTTAAEAWTAFGGGSVGKLNLGEDTTTFLRNDGTWVTPSIEDALTVNGHTVNSDVPANAVFTDTTYESKAAASGGTEVSLVTTGEKYIWNNKGTYSKPSGGIPDSDIASAATWNAKGNGTITGITMNGSSKGTSGVVDLGTVITAHQDISGKLNASLKGAANGLAELDANGKVPSTQLPSYVDDVLEYTAKANFPTTGETGKIYVDTTTNLTYRWGGSAYIEISASLALGETSSTAYRGDRGKIAYDHSQSTHARTDATAVAASSTNGNIKINGTETTVYTHPGSGTNPHGTTKSDVGLGNVGNFKAVSTVANQGLTDTEKSNARTNIGAGTSSLTLGTSSSTAYRGDYGNSAYAHAVTNKGSAFSSGLYKITTNSEGHVTAATAVAKADITGLGIPAQDTTYESRAAESGGTDLSLVTTGEKYNWSRNTSIVSISSSAPDSALTGDIWFKITT